MLKVVLTDLPSLPAASYAFPHLKTLHIMQYEDDNDDGSFKLQDVLAPLAKPACGIANTVLQSLTIECGAMAFPEIICHLQALTSMYLNGGKFCHLPAELSNLKSQKTLQLRRGDDGDTALNIHRTLLHNMPSLNTLCFEAHNANRINSFQKATITVAEAMQRQPAFTICNFQII